MVSLFLLLSYLASPSEAFELHVFDPATRRTIRAPMPVARFGIGAAVLGNRLYVIGGGTNSGTIVNTVQAYDPVNNTWITKASMPTARAQLGGVRATLDGQSRIFAVGGSGAYGHRNEAYTP